MTTIDVSSESTRSYHYENGAAVIIDDPKTVYVLESGSHRVVTKGGRTYRPTPGWLAISWVPRDGEPEFVA